MEKVRKISLIVAEFLDFMEKIFQLTRVDRSPLDVSPGEKWNCDLVKK